MFHSIKEKIAWAVIKSKFLMLFQIL